MRALLITKEGIKEVEIGTNHEKLMATLEDRPMSKGDHTLKSMYYYIGCHTVTGAGELDKAHVCYADDEGMFKLDDGSQVTTVSWHPEKLVGKLLVTGFDPTTGETIPATMDVDDLRSMVKVGELRYE